MPLGACWIKAADKNLEAACCFLHVQLCSSSWKMTKLLLAELIFRSRMFLAVFKDSNKFLCVTSFSN